jgi:AhpD family alkylhydroperoxidase
VSERIDYIDVAPAGVKALGTVYGYIMQCGLSEKFIELIFLRVSQINGCAYCVDLHMRDLLEKEKKVKKLVMLPVWREAGDVFDKRERAGLAWAETVTRVAETAIPDEEYDAARVVFSEKELVDLTIAIGLMNAFDRMAIGFRRPPLTASAK